MFVFKVCDLSISLSKAKVMQRKLKQKIREDWCLSALSRYETFSNVIFVDETCIEMGSSGRIFFHQKSMRLECSILKIA